MSRAAAVDLIIKGLSGVISAGAVIYDLVCLMCAATELNSSILDDAIFTKM